MKKKILWLTTVLACIALVVGCSGGDTLSLTRSASSAVADSGWGDDVNEGAVPSTVYEYEVMAEEAVFGDYDYDVADDEEPVEAPETTMASPSTGGGGEIAVENIVQPRKIIRTIHLSLQTLDFDESVDDIALITEDYGGYIQDSYVEGTNLYEKYGVRYASFTARVPEERLDSYVSNLSGKFNVTSLQQNSNDITDNYYDVQARLNTLITQEERLQALLAEAEDLESLIQLEAALADVHYQIDSYTSAMNRMDSSVSMSTVFVNLEEVVEYSEQQNAPASFGERISQTFEDSLKGFGNFFKDLLLTLILLLPFLLLLAVIAIVVTVLVRRRMKKGRKAKQAPGQQKMDPKPPVE